MKLSTRISVFFLVALAVVLVSFSVSIYLLVHTHLLYQLDDRADDALDTLNAEVEAGSDGLEWEGNDRKPTFASTVASEPIVWAVFDSNGQRLDGSTNEPARRVLTAGAVQGTGQDKEQITSKEESWRIARRYLRADEDHGRSRIKGLPREEESKTKYYSSLTLAVGTPLRHLTNQLRLLAFALAGMSVLIWLFAAFLGRWLCGNALAPLTRMANSMSTISAADLSQRLPAVDTGDELEDLSRAFNDLLTRLQISFERQRRFAAEASHQLRTPLTAMLGQVDVALRRERGADEYRGTLTSVHAQAMRLRQIAEMLLFLTREEADAALPSFELLDVNQWLTAHLMSWNDHSRSTDIRLEIDEPSPLWIQAHKGLLSQVIDNLLDNACKYSDVGTDIVIRAVRCDGEAQIEIEDSGYGIPENEINRVLDPFFRSVDVQRRGIQGAGLGLSIVQRIVVAFGARLQIHSRIARGSRFAVMFPAPAVEQLRSA